jgi:maltose O-acetyltransferase
MYQLIATNLYLISADYSLENNTISIGKNGLIDLYVQRYMVSHPLMASEPILEDKHVSRYLTSTKPVSIGDNVWIGVNTVIFPGVVIGNNVTIGQVVWSPKVYLKMSLPLAIPVKSRSNFKI